MEFHLIELPKLPKELGADCSDIELWAKFIHSERKEDFVMVAESNPYIESAYKRLQVISHDTQKQLEYEAREKAILDHNQMMLEAREEGEARINKLNASLIRDKRLEDLERATRDRDFQQKLMLEYDI